MSARNTTFLWTNLDHSATQARESLNTSSTLTRCRPLKRLNRMADSLYSDQTPTLILIWIIHPRGGLPLNHEACSTHACNTRIHIISLSIINLYLRPPGQLLYHGWRIKKNQHHCPGNQQASDFQQKTIILP